MSIINSLEHKRFGLLLGSLSLLILGDLFFSKGSNDIVIQALVFQTVLFSAMVFRKKSRRDTNILYAFGAAIMFNLLLTIVDPVLLSQKFRQVIYFAYFVFVTIHLFIDLYRMPHLDREAIFGVFSGFILLAICSGFLFMVVDNFQPNSFSGIEDHNDLSSFIYFSFITLMTIGYGDISPASLLARKVVVSIALIGHFYTVFVTAIIVSKVVNN